MNLINIKTVTVNKWRGKETQTVSSSKWPRIQPWCFYDTEWVSENSNFFSELLWKVRNILSMWLKSVPIFKRGLKTHLFSVIGITINAKTNALITCKKPFSRQHNYIVYYANGLSATSDSKILLYSKLSPLPTNGTAESCDWNIGLRWIHYNNRDQQTVFVFPSLSCVLPPGPHYQYQSAGYTTRRGGK